LGQAAGDAFRVRGERRANPAPARDVSCSWLSPLIEHGRVRLGPQLRPAFQRSLLVPALKLRGHTASKRVGLLSQHFSTPRPVPQVTIFVTPGGLRESPAGKW
jgi:hypothetical protein